MPHPAVSEIERLARRLASSRLLDVVGVQVFTHRIPMTVEIRIRRADGSDVTLEECAAFSAPLGEVIESAGVLEASYLLEISSPGVGEDLLTDRDFDSFRGFPVEVLRRDSGGVEASRQGSLLGRDDQAVLINLRGRTLRIPRDEVIHVRLMSTRSAP